VALLLEPILTYTPPKPRSTLAVVALLRAALRGDGDLLALLPAAVYRSRVGRLGYSRRQLMIVNEPDEVRRVLSDADGIFPKSDLMVEALQPLIGDSIFVSSGALWQKQRAMIDPAFTMMRVHRAFPDMVAGAANWSAELDHRVEDQQSFSLDLAMSHLTADIICRTVFSTGFESAAARDVFEAFTLFERSVAQVEIRRLILDPAWSAIPQKPDVLEACQVIRRHLGTLLDSHLAAGASFDDIAMAVMAARDQISGQAFSREELIDELGVLFLAGHETSASALTWAFFILAMQPDWVRRLRQEVTQVAGDGPIQFEQIKALTMTRNIVRETLRLYPPITFLPRVALQDTRIGGRRVKRGALIMVAPWVIHRHRDFWIDPHVFDPDRFTPEREGEITPGSYIPFGLGPRVCAGAAFALTEAVLLLATLFRRFDFHVIAPERVRAAARLTTRPVEQIQVRVTLAPGQSK
jgi:cytochrome P450